MRLLVSVRSEDEATDALAGGADIVDAKEPARGSLGSVTRSALRAIAARVPETVPLSVALGDVASAGAVTRAMASVEVGPRFAPTYVKLGFAGASSQEVVTALIGEAVRAASGLPCRPCVVAVGYADHEGADSRAPHGVLRAAIAAGAGAYLIDTFTKNGAGLLDWIELERLRALCAEGRSAGLLVAVAGSLRPASLEGLARVADVVGVRGAACRGGRQGRVDAGLVRQLRERLPPEGPEMGATLSLAEREARPG